MVKVSAGASQCFVLAVTNYTWKTRRVLLIRLNTFTLVVPLALWFVVRLEYKYSRLVMSANKECELPAADSCALAEGEEPEDDVVYTQKPSLLGKLRAIANKVGV